MFLWIILLYEFCYQEIICSDFENESGCKNTKEMFGYTKCVWGNIDKTEKCVNILDMISCSEFMNEEDCNITLNTNWKLHELYCIWNKENSKCISNLNLEINKGIIFFISIICGYIIFLIVLNILKCIRRNKKIEDMKKKKKTKKKEKEKEEQEKKRRKGIRRAKLSKNVRTDIDDEFREKMFSIFLQLKIYEQNENNTTDNNSSSDGLYF
jgi:large-conductance mechanosensitive channel